MTRNVSLRELLVGVEGLALLRNLYDGTDDAADERLQELRRVLDDPALAAAEATPEHDAASGYAIWSDSYDEPGNPIIAIEERVVGELLAPLPARRARSTPPVARDATPGNSSTRATRCPAPTSRRR